VRLWVVALALLGGGFISRLILAARGAYSDAATELQIVAFGLGLMLWMYWLMFRASRVWYILGYLLTPVFVIAAGIAVLSSMRP
jgi:hypothetical protein